MYFGEERQNPNEIASVPFSLPPDVEAELLTDPIGSKRGSSRVLRGGSWNDGAADCRSASGNSFAPTFRGDLMGFRLALSPSRESGVKVAESSTIVLNRAEAERGCRGPSPRF